MSLATGAKKYPGEILRSAVEAAKLGADGTARLMPRMGRSSYLGDRVLGYPDPGAKAVAIWLDAILGALFPEAQGRSDAEPPTASRF